MTPVSMTVTPKPTDTTETACSGFRLGEDQPSDATGSDSDQSAHRERDLSPTRDAKVSKSKKRRALKQERRQVGALTDELGTLLGAAFQEPNDSLVNIDVAHGT